MQLQQFLFYLIFFTLLSMAMRPTEGRGGGRRGGFFGSWRKVKKPSAQSSSRRNHNNNHNSGSTGGSYSVASNNNNNNNPGYAQLKTSVIQNKGRSMFNPTKESMPAGATYYGSRSSLPDGAVYHPYPYQAGATMPKGATYYSNAAALPSGAVFYTQPPSGPSFSPSNFLLGMYTGQLLGHGLFGHRSYATHIHQEQPAAVESPTEQMRAINGSVPITTEVVASAVVTTDRADDNATTQEAGSHAGDNSASIDSNEDSSTKADSSVRAQESPTSEDGATVRIICLPMLLNAVNASDDSAQAHPVEKIVCYPTPIVPADNPQNDTGIICVERKVQMPDAEDTPQEVVVTKHDCYPAPPADHAAEVTEAITKSPESVIGNIPTEEELSNSHQAVLETLRQEELRTMQEFFDHFASTN